MVEATGLGLFLYRPVAWCFLRGMKYLSILIVGVALATSGVANDKAEIERLKKEIEALKAKQEVHRLRQELAELKKEPTVNNDQIKYIGGIPYLKGEKEPFTGTVIGYRKDGSKSWEIPYVNGKRHGTGIVYNEYGSKWGKIPFLNGKRHGTQIEYNRDGSKVREFVYENGKEISQVEF